MPGRVKVRILNARDLPIMDRASELTDAFVEVRFGPDTFKTDVCKKSLNPQWNSDWFKFEVDDEILQDEPLDLKVLDYDTYSSHDTIGKVYIDLNPLLSRESSNTLSGWFPIYDTMHGLRGELSVQVRVELFTDFNKFRQSSCGIQLFCSCEVPAGWRIQAMLGFIEELVVNDDPEHQWIEKIRTPRASNEARQRIFSKLSGTLQRKLGVKVLEMGGNAVLGYFQNFDLEGESGIVVRAVGTAVSLTRTQQSIGQQSPAVLPSSVSPGKERVRRHSLSIHHSSRSQHHHHNKHNTHNDNIKHSHHQQQHHINQSTPKPVKRRGSGQNSSGVVSPALSTSSSPSPFTSPWPRKSSADSSGRGRGGSARTGRGRSISPDLTDWCDIAVGRRSPPPTAPAVIHATGSSSSSSQQSVFRFPHSSAPFSDVAPTTNVVTTTSPSTAVIPTPPPPTTATTVVNSQSRSLQVSPDMNPSSSTTLETSPSAPSPTSSSATAAVTSSDIPVGGSGHLSFSQNASLQQEEQQTTSSGDTKRQSISPIRITPEPGETRTRRMSESEVNSPPRVGSVPQAGTPINVSATARLNLSKNAMFQQSIDLLEYPFFTMRSFPPGFIVSLGGVVSARSVKLLDKIHNPEEPQTRDAWWTELRVEIKSHALKLGCHAVLGYSESTTICDEVIVLSAAGTAAKIDFLFEEHSSHGITGTAIPLVNALTGTGSATHPSSTSPMAGTTPGQLSERVVPPASSAGKDLKDKHLFVDIGLANRGLQRSFGSVDVQDEAPTSPNCSMCHIPYCPSNLPFEIQLSKCSICRKSSVPEVLFMTIDPPSEMPIWSKGCLVQARICRGRSNKNKSSEQSAREVSDILPFIEYEVHNQLINKLKIRGLNGLFGLKIQVVVGDNMIVAVGTATGAFLGALPSPPQPTISSEVASAHESQDLAALQKKITRTVHMHRERLNSEIVERQEEYSPLSRPPTDDETDDDDVEENNFFVEKTKDKNTFILVIDDIKDESVALMLHDVIPPEGFDICNTQTLPGIGADKISANMQMFSQMLTVKYQPHLHNSIDFSNVFNSIMRRLCFKLRHFRPCCIADISFHIDLPDEDEINISVTGCCIGLLDTPNDAPAVSTLMSSKPTGHNRSLESQQSTASTAQVGHTEELMFPLDGVGDQTCNVTSDGGASSAYHNRQGSVSSHANKAINRQSRIVQKPKLYKGIELTPLNKIFNGKIDRYLGYYNFFFIRESTAVKEGGGIGGFLQSFILEVKAIVRAHVTALGGNALVAYNMCQFVLDDNPHKNQGQCLINVSGDVVVVHYDDEDGDPMFVDMPVCVPTV